MEGLAAAIPAEEVGRVGYKLYERFRPAWKASTRSEGACGCMAWPRALLWLGTA